MSTEFTIGTLKRRKQAAKSSARLFRALFRRSNDPEAPENKSNQDWQDGYFIGCSIHCGDLIEEELWSSGHSISMEWERRGEPGPGDKKFQSWKHGYWAGRLQL